MNWFRRALFFAVVGTTAMTLTLSIAASLRADEPLPSDMTANGIYNFPVIDHRPSSERKQQQKWEGVGLPMPDYTLLDATGKPVSTSQFRGRVIVFDTWLTGCGPCLREMPYLAQLAKSYSTKDVVILAVCCDAHDEETVFQQRLKEFSNLGLQIYADPRGWLDKSGLRNQLHNSMGSPTQIVVDQTGKIVGTLQGFDDSDTNLTALRKSIDIALSGKART